MAARAASSALDSAGKRLAQRAAHCRESQAGKDSTHGALAVVGKVPDTSLRALVPNYRGAERAVAAGVPKISCLVAASPTYQRLNSATGEDLLVAST